MTAKSTTPKTVPYDKRGNLWPWSSDDSYATWQPNTPFDATLHFGRLQEHRWGRRIVRFFLWSTVTGSDEEAVIHIYAMLPEALDDLIASGVTIAKRQVTGRWIVEKRGRVYGIRLATAEDKKRTGSQKAS